MTPVEELVERLANADLGGGGLDGGDATSPLYWEPGDAGGESTAEHGATARGRPRRWQGLARRFLGGGGGGSSSTSAA